MSAPDLSGERVLPLVVRVERGDPPTRTDALEAAARAVLMALAAPDPQWQQAVRAWEAGGEADPARRRIRKVVRRARGAQWQRAGELAGLAVVHRTAEVRVFAPIPLDGWPPELARLQVSGTELVDPEPPEAADPALPLVLITPHIPMTAGKAMAQAGHAAQLGWWAADGALRQRWAAQDFALAVRTATAAQWDHVMASGVPVVEDGGFTEVEPGSRTAAIVLPER